MSNTIACKACGYQADSSMIYCVECGSNLKIQQQQVKINEVTEQHLKGESSEIEHTYLIQYSKINEQINGLQDVEQQLYTQEHHYNQLSQELQYLQNQLGYMKQKVEQEYRDVERLEKLSWGSILAKVKGDKEAQIEKEHQEYLAAVTKLENVEENLKSVHQNHSKASNDLNTIRSLVERKQQLQQDLYDLIHEACKDVSDVQEDQLENDVKRLRDQLQPISRHRATATEAMEHLTRGHQSLNSARRLLHDASDYSNFDTFFGGGVFMDSMKHSRFGEARSYIRSAENSLRQAYRVFPGLPQTRYIHIENMDGFFDIWFDNIFSDMAARRKINRALDSVNQAIYDVDNAINFIRVRVAELGTSESQIKGQLKDKQSQLTHRRRVLIEQAIKS